MGYNRGSREKKVIPEFHLYTRILRYLEAVGNERCVYTMGRMILGQLSRLLPFDMGYFILFDPHGRVTFCATENVDERSKRQYFDYYIQIDPCRLSTPVEMRRITTDWRVFKNTEFYVDYASREHVDFSTGLQFHYPDGSLLSVLFVTRSGSRGFDNRELHVLDLLQPQLENLLVLAWRGEDQVLPAGGPVPVAGIAAASEQETGKLAAPNPFALLTPRERQIVTFISMGIPTKEIGSSLLIRPATVYRHISNIFEKTGTSSRTELLALLSGAHLAHSHG
jgi:DNA-binding CsgD family transcriptional regulator